MSDRRQRSTQPRGPFGDLVLVARVACGMTLRGLARALDVAPSHISDVERGRRLPSRELVGDICRALAIPEADRDPWHAAAGLLGDGMLDALLARPERWGDVRRVLGVGQAE